MGTKQGENSDADLHAGLATGRSGFVLCLRVFKVIDSFLRGLLTIYPFILLIDARIAKRNTWYPNLDVFILPLFAFAGIAYEGYYYNRQNKKNTLR